jgi:hypothetical protein
MILNDEDPTYEDTKGISLPKLAKINQIKVKPFSEVSRFDWLPAPLARLFIRILLQAYNTSLEVMLNKSLGDIVILLAAVCPIPLLAMMIIPLVLLVNCVKNSVPLTQQFDLVPSLPLRSLKLFHHCACRSSRRINVLNTVLLHILKSIFVAPPNRLLNSFNLFN